MENIEAMLCAYIEGDLDQAGRAEIEKHLTEHPQHRKMIEELIATRDLVRGLPRVSAPGDVGESLRGQVERSILLDDPNAPSRPSSMRLRRWPQLMAIAAVFLLVSGLAIVVYNTVMPTFRSPAIQQVSVATPSRKDEVAKADSTDDEKEVAVADAAKPIAPASVHAVLSAPLVPAPTNDHAMLTEATPSTTFDLAAVQHRLAGSAYGASLDNNVPVYLVIDSPNPTTTNDKIARFLNSNGISWSPIPDSTAPTTVPSIAAVAGQGQGGGGADQSAGAPAPVLAPAARLNFGNNATTQQSQTNNIATNNLAAENSGQSLRQAHDNNQLPLPITPAPSTTEPSKQEQVLGDNDKLRDSNSPIRDIYVARKMTRKQADELRAEIAGSQDAPVRLYDQAGSKGATNGSATQPADMLMQSAKSDGLVMKFIAGASATTAPSTQPSPAVVATPIVSGDILSVRTQNIELPPGIDADQSLPVADDGTISLPGLGPIKVSDLTPAQATDAIVKAYTDAKPGAAPTVEVKKISAKVTTDATAAAPAATAAGTVAASDAVDVVIVIQNTPAQQPPLPVIAAPTTRPAAPTIATPTPPSAQ